MPSEAAAHPAFPSEIDDARMELSIRLYAIPAALVAAKIVMASSFLHMLSRVFLSMWIHELGHAATAWLCGFIAIPGPWRTIVPDARNFVVPVLVAGGIGWLTFRGYSTRKRSLLIGAGVLFAAQLKGTFALNADTARALITFGGDAGCFVIGSLLMASMYADPDTQIHRGWLRWGFLVIGAVAFMDTFDTWWSARTDLTTIPFGENEGSGPSDASVLVDEYNWDALDLVNRYLKLAGACAVALGAVYVYGWWEAKARLLQLKRHER